MSASNPAQCIAETMYLTARFISDQTPLEETHASIQKDLYEMIMKLAESDANKTFDLGQVSELKDRVVPLCEGAKSQMAKQALSKLAKLMDDLSMNNALSLPVPNKQLDIQMPRSKRSVAERIARQNDRASSFLPQETEGLNDYPFTAEQKKLAQKSRVIINSMSFLNQNEIYSDSSKLNSCICHSACAKGERKYMEDRYLAVPFTFIANGKTISADVFGILDGHGGEKTVDYVRDNLATRLQEKLQQRLDIKDPNDEDIFHALQETILSLHQDCIRCGFPDGTTAVIGFKIADSNDLWTANLGDSSAFLNRNGTVIGMSVEQKPFYFVDENMPEGVPSFDLPNKYATHLEKMGVIIVPSKQQGLQGLTRKVKCGLEMTLNYLYTEDNRHKMLLGIPNEFYLDMAGSIGDPRFAAWAKHSPEIFRQKLQPNDLMILHSDGVDPVPLRVIEIIEKELKSGYSIQEIVEWIVHESTSNEDNVSAMIVDFSQTSKE